MTMTKTFNMYNQNSILNGRIEEERVKIAVKNYNHNTFEVAQYKIKISDSQRVLVYVTTITFITDTPHEQLKIEMPPTRTARGTQWLVTMDKAYDMAFQRALSQE